MSHEIIHREEDPIEINYAKRTGFYTMSKEHMHEGGELYYLISGKRDYFIRDRTYRVERGGFVFIIPRELHRTIDTGEPDHERVLFNFPASMLDALPLTGRNGVVTLSPQERWKGEALVRELIAEGKGDAPGRAFMIELLLKQLLMLVIRAQAERCDEATPPSAIHKTMSEIAAYVGLHYDRPLLLKEVAERFFISPYYLSRKFKQCTGFGFAEYVQLVRVRESQRLLRETELKIIEIAERSGIGPVAHFHKLFKKMTGCSPLQYRKSRQHL